MNGLIPYRISYVGTESPTSDNLSPEAKALLEAAEAGQAELLRKRADSRTRVAATVADEALKRQAAAHAARDEERKSEQAQQRAGDDSAWYGIGFGITAFIVFIGSWIYCIVAYGFLFGVGLGWLPSAIVAVIVGALWPLLALAIAVIGLSRLHKLRPPRRARAAQTAQGLCRAGA